MTLYSQALLPVPEATAAAVQAASFKGNADTERFMRTLKEECLEECLWLRDWTFPIELIRALEGQIADCNEHYLHSALSYKPPGQFERDY